MKACIISQDNYRLAKITNTLKEYLDLDLNFYKTEDDLLLDIEKGFIEYNAIFFDRNEYYDLHNEILIRLDQNNCNCLCFFLYPGYTFFQKELHRFINWIYDIDNLKGAIFAISSRFGLNIKNSCISRRSSYKVLTIDQAKYFLPIIPMNIFYREDCVYHLWKRKGDIFDFDKAKNLISLNKLFYLDRC